MKRLLGIVAIALLAMIVWRQWDRRMHAVPDPPIVAEPPKGVELDTVMATWGGLRFPVPVEWKDNRRTAGLAQVLFDGPRDKGAPVVSAFWIKSEKNIDAWAQSWVDKYDQPKSMARVIEKTWTTIGGRRAFLMVYELQDPGAKTELEATTHIEMGWFLQNAGHVGFFRCTSERAYFPIDYRPFFESLAARITYLRPR